MVSFVYSLIRLYCSFNSSNSAADEFNTLNKAERKKNMIKKFIALATAVLVMASLSVSAFARPTYYTDERTENGVTGKIYYEADNAYYRRFYASTSANSRLGYIYAGVLLENSLNNAYIGSDNASGHNIASVDAFDTASYGTVTYVRVTGTHQGGSGSSEDEMKINFDLCKIFVM